MSDKLHPRDEHLFPNMTSGNGAGIAPQSNTPPAALHAAEVGRGLSLPFYRSEAVKFHLQNDLSFEAPRDHLPKAVRVACISLVPVLAAIFTIALIKQPRDVAGIILSPAGGQNGEKQQFLLLPAAYASELGVNKSFDCRSSTGKMVFVIAGEPSVVHAEDALLRFHLSGSLIASFGGSVVLAPVKETSTGTKAPVMQITVQLRPYRLISLVHSES